MLGEAVGELVGPGEVDGATVSNELVGPGKVDRANTVATELDELAGAELIEFAGANAEPAVGIVESSEVSVILLLITSIIDVLSISSIIDVLSI